MAESLGTLVDALMTTAMKLWHVQDQVYRYDRMTPEEYAQVPSGESHKAWKQLAALNLDRNRLMRMIDEALADAVRTGQARIDARIKLT